MNTKRTWNMFWIKILKIFLLCYRGHSYLSLTLMFDPWNVNRCSCHNGKQALKCVWHAVIYFNYFLPFICHTGILEWPFWTKLVVVAIGFTGGLVFMYVQCKVYIQLWKRLKAYNRVIYVQNRPETCKKNVFDKPSLLEPNLDNKEALGPAQSDTNSSQYTETEDYSMEILHVWSLGTTYTPL